MNKALKAEKQRACGLVFGSLAFFQVTSRVILVKKE